FFCRIVDEIKSLGEHGLIVKKYDGETIKAKVYLVMATGDIPQITKFCHHKGHMAKSGCRICLVQGQGAGPGRGGMYFQSRTAALRTLESFVNGDPINQLMKPDIFTKLPTFLSSSFHVLDELHALGQGIARFVHEMVVKVNQNPKMTNFYSKNADGSFNSIEYTFKLNTRQLENVGTCIELSRSKIPVSFQGSWDNLIAKVDGARAIDFLDFLLYVVPTLIVPLFSKAATRKALLCLVRGCAIALQWEINENLIIEMENCFANWHYFLDEEIKKKNISVSVFKPNNHYLTHTLGLKIFDLRIDALYRYIIRKAGSMRSYSARSMERTIGRYSKLIKSRVAAGKNAGNLVERLSMRSYFNLAVNITDLLDTVKPKKKHRWTISLNFPFPLLSIKIINYGALLLLVHYHQPT
ncbi:hypothetical protein BD770DRAFT_334331, partial [Pilaira anomala]